MLIFPSLVVAIFTFIAGVIIMTHDEAQRVPIKVFSLSFFMQTLVYVLYTFVQLENEERQLLTRTSVVFIALAISTILLTVRMVGRGR